MFRKSLKVILLLASVNLAACSTVNDNQFIETDKIYLGATEKQTLVIPKDNQKFEQSGKYSIPHVQEGQVGDVNIMPPGFSID